MKKYIEFTDPITNSKVYAKIERKEVIDGFHYTKGKGYYVTKDFDYYSVYETDVEDSPRGGYRRGMQSWQVFKTKSKQKAIKVAKYLAKMSD